MITILSGSFTAGDFAALEKIFTMGLMSYRDENICRGPCDFCMHKNVCYSVEKAISYCVLKAREDAKS